MCRAEEELEKMGYTLRESDSSDRQEVDFDICDKEDNVAWAWGDRLDEVDWECNHPYDCIEFGDGEEQGKCLLCGAYCDYRYEEDDEGHKTPEPHEWYPPKKIGGIVGEYLKELQKRW